MKNTSQTLKKFLSLKMPSGYSKPIHFVTLALNFFGILMVISATMGSASASVNSLLFTGVKEMVFVVVGYIAMVFMARNFSFTFFRKHFNAITLFVFASLLITLIFPAVGGAKAWIRIGPITIQPAEFAKIFMILVIALKLGDKRNINPRITWFDLIKLPLVILFGIVAIIVILQGDFGSALVIIGITVICFLVPTNQKLWPIQKFTMFLIVFAFILVFFLTTPTGIALLEAVGIPGYMLNRFKIAANPFIDRYGDPYQLFMGMVSMVKGVEYGFFGRGYGNSINKYGYLPESQTDFILAIVVEELGVFGIIFVIASYSTIVYYLLSNAILFKKERDKIVLIGVTSYLLIHIILNVGGATGFIPLTGVPLLFISAGGSGRMAFMIAIGLAQNVIARNIGLKKRNRGKLNANRIG